MIDSHCHLAGEEFVDDLAAVVARAKEAGVTRALVILAADDEAEIARVDTVLAAWPEARTAVGVHPHTAHRHADDPESVGALVERRLAALPSARAIGEIGLDYHYDFSPRDVQQAVFRAQLRVARKHGWPVVLHVREAVDDTLRILEEERADGRLSGVFHCFTGDRRAAEAALGTGFMLSIPGIVTFPKSTALVEAASVVPEDRLLIETDSPYLAPVPHRGRRNEPAFVARTFDAVARARGVEGAALAATLAANFDALFERRRPA